MANYIKGIDVSHWEPEIEWAKLASQGIYFAFIKATQANFPDPNFASHWAGAKQAGMLRGAYHFLDPRMDGKLQAETFLKTVKLEHGDLPPVLDLEELKIQTAEPAKDSHGSKGPKDQKGKKAGRRMDVKPTDDTTKIPGSHIVGCAEQWLKTVEAETGRTPIIYSGPSFLEHRFLGLNNSTPFWADKYVLWVANYLDHEVGENDLPIQPKGWPDWKFWQYSEDALIEGITGDGRPTEVDVNFFRGTVDQLYALAGTTRPVDTVGDIPKIEVLEQVEKGEVVVTTEPHPAEPQPHTMPQTSTDFMKYTIKSGDTLSGLAGRFNTTVDAIMQVNPQIKNANMIFDGESLNIPQG